MKEDQEDGRFTAKLEKLRIPRRTMEQVECLAPSEKKSSATMLLSPDVSPSALILAAREHSSSECSLASTGTLKRIVRKTLSYVFKESVQQPVKFERMITLKS